MCSQIHKHNADGHNLAECTMQNHIRMFVEPVVCLWLANSYAYDQETADICILTAAFGQEPQQVSPIFSYQ